MQLLKTKLYLERRIRTNRKRIDPIISRINEIKLDIDYSSDLEEVEVLTLELNNLEEDCRYLNNKNVFLKERARTIKEKLKNV